MSDSVLPLHEASLTGLEVFANPSDLRQDIHVFMDYARAHEIKRGHRDNLLPRSQQQRLARLMSDPVSAGKLNESGASDWINEVDNTCLALKFISYDTEGDYVGYTSTQRSYPDNYIKVDEKRYERFIELPLQAQEEQLMEAHLNAQGCDSEFFVRGTLSRSDTFGAFGCACGVVPTIPFHKVRRHLLSLLARCPIGVWLATESLVEYLKLTDPWFLIPKELPASVRAEGWKEGRYGNFSQRKRGDWGSTKQITSSDPEAFAEVEGRYIERFLEGFPLVLGYTEVAYRKSKPNDDVVPCRGLVEAFRVTERLRQVIRREIRAPKVTVLPNFEVHVESLFFPARTDTSLLRLGNLAQRGIVSVFRLDKTRVAAALAKDSEEDPIACLERLAGQPLPANVKQELTVWAGHSEKFVLYEGFSLLEGERNGTNLDGYIAQEISPDLALVRSAEKLYKHLEIAEQVPLRIRHPEQALTAPAGIKSRLAPRTTPSRPRAKNTLKLKRSVQTTLRFPDASSHAVFCKLLLDAKCVVGSDANALTITYSRKVQGLVEDCLKKLRQEFAVQLEDI